MDINATLLGQMFTFAVFVWFTMKYVWPPITKAMAERQDKIADGLAAAERGRLDLELAQKRVADNLREAKQSASEIMDKANIRGAQMVEDAKAKARSEGANLLEMAQSEIAKEVQAAKQQLRDQISKIAILGAEKILSKEIDAQTNGRLVEQVIAELEKNG